MRCMLVGGICHDIADAICGVLDRHNINSTQFFQPFGEVHVSAVAQFKEGIYEIDINPYAYETGGGYSWKKIKNVNFDASDVIVSKLDPDPSKFKDYTEY